MIYAAQNLNLGALPSQNSSFAGDLNTLTEPGIYAHTGSASNKPFDYGVLIVFPALGAYQIQLDVNLSSGAVFAIRSGLNGTWKSFSA